MNKNKLLIAIIAAASSIGVQAADIPSITVSSDVLFRDTTVVSPTARITAEEAKAINATTTEDIISHEPNLIIRKRFIGDANGTIGIRGSNMFQTTRTSVYADGLPLHYFLQTSFSGAPRWSLVGPDEVEEVEVIYGPFSAEYGGGSMGGVVNIKTRDPKERRVVLQGSLFSQDYDNRQTGESYIGGKFFSSFEDKIGNLGLFLSYNHLENDSQPQTQFAAKASGGGGTVVSGTQAGVEEHGDSVTYYGDSGATHNTSDLVKIKMNYDLGDYQLRGSIAYEERQFETDDLNNYLQDAAGNTVWDDNVTTTGGTNFKTSNFGSSVFQERTRNRDSLLLGLGLTGPLDADGDWVFDIYATDFTIIKDEEERTGRNPAEPTFAAANAAFKGRLTEYDDTGWQTLDVKAGTESLSGNENLRLSIGYNYSAYELEINPFKYNSISNTKDATRGASGGETFTHSVFAQWGWLFNPEWDVSVGLRYDDWRGENGFFDDDADGVITGTEKHDDRHENGFSPKFSLAHFITKQTTLRYSIARALRFPVTEELYQNVNEALQVSVADANLEPEDGIFQNIMLEHKFKNGLVRFNLFYDEVDDVIFSQNVTVNGSTLRTFLPVDTVKTKGAEFVYNQNIIMGSKFNTRFNVSYTDAEITKNSLDTSIEGNTFPRLPNWRANLLVGYPLSEKLNAHAGIRYASNSYGDLDNSDKEENVFGAQDEYIFVNAKLNWQATKTTQFSVGVDNIFDEEAYVHHPWPSRTFFLEGKLTF
ncbi:MAG: TonB-dependent receptor [Piscirickettsiaceae bacterium]|nr:MAG: TonB-dependent receptor [Piscirickettsiaceae bacterium]